MYLDSLPPLQEPIKKQYLDSRKEPIHVAETTGEKEKLRIERENLRKEIDEGFPNILKLVQHETGNYSMQVLKDECELRLVQNTVAIRFFGEFVSDFMREKTKLDLVHRTYFIISGDRCIAKMEPQKWQQSSDCNNRRTNTKRFDH